MKHKILQLNVTANWGSTGKIAEGIGLAAISRGWKSAIAFGRMQNPSASELIKVGSQWDVYAHYVRNRIFDGEGRGSIRATKRLVENIDRFAPDIVHLHNIHDHWLNFPILIEFLKKSGVKVVWTFHDCWAFTGGCSHFVEQGCDKWKTQCRNCQFPRAVFDHTYKNFQLKKELFLALGPNLTIVSVSHWLDSLVAQSMFKDLDHRVIYNGVDTSVFYPRPVEEINRKYALSGKCVLLGVSSVWPESKGLSDYAALRRRLSEEFVIILVGLSPRQIKTLPHGIIGIPRTNSADELAALYSRADAVLCLSKAETFGLTLVEGLACGTPTVGYAGTAIKEIIDNETGIAVVPGNINQIKDAVMQIAGKHRIFRPEVCRNKALECYNRDIQFGKYIDLYDELISC